jgi:hypothetical protein
MRKTLFGSKEQKDADRRREEKIQKKIEELRARGEQKEEPTAVGEKAGRFYKVAAFVDPAINKDYVVATTWDGLESIGSEEWVKAKKDRGEQYVG